MIQLTTSKHLCFCSEFPMGASEGFFDHPDPETTRADSLRPFAGIFAVTICGVCAFLDMYSTQPLLPLFVQLFHASKADVGLTVSASTLGVAAAAPFVGSYAERYNRKNIIVGSIFYPGDSEAGPHALRSPLSYSY